METASSAQVAEAYGIPFLGIRILSNSEIHGEDFDGKSGSYCQEYVLNVTRSYIEKVENLPSHKQSINLYLNSEILNLSTQPIIKNGIIYTPVRELFTKLGGDVNWDSKKHVVEVKVNDIETILNNESALFIDGTSYVPAESIPKITGQRISVSGLNQIRIYQ